MFILCTFTFTVNIETKFLKKKGNPEEEIFIYFVLKTLYLLVLNNY